MSASIIVVLIANFLLIVGVLNREIMIRKKAEALNEHRLAAIWRGPNMFNSNKDKIDKYIEIIDRIFNF